MSAKRLVRLIRYPVSSTERWARRRAAGAGLPVGRTAQQRRLLRAALGQQGSNRILVVGPTASVRQALPGCALDVVGTSPYDPEVTVVAQGLGRGALPRRWDCVVVTEQDATAERLLAVVGACLPGGSVAVLVHGPGEAPALPGAPVERMHHARGLRVLVARTAL